MNFKLLLVEDNDVDIEACTSTIRTYNLKNKTDMTCIVAKSKEQAFECVDSSFDGAIIDIKLADAGTEGNDVIKEIHKASRIPIAILTGTPENATAECGFIGSFKKGEISYADIFDKLFAVYRTGITKVMGGRGEIETAMTKIFWDHLLPQVDSWKSYVSEGNETEKAILRTVLNHLLELLDGDDNPSHPEEMYVIPPIADQLKTGSVVVRRADDKRFVVVSPACDLVVRPGGTCKTDKILLSQIEDFDVIKAAVLEGIKAGKQVSKLAVLLKNNHNDYYHYLPKTTLFTAGFINFRWTHSVDKGVFEAEYGKPVAQLSAPFVKAIVARFSSFYARQGQPDFDFKKLAESLL
ncbi:response regulator [Geomonas ferrireducens]|uniref:response regulator n=1 Tax=Geomonas ferrireducens TaxID=2570227 RepID=UPI0010A8B764|nr:response regulator [Geomonas ferrireducens]